ncbi:YdcF family protein [Nocardia sp. CDC159]|uniref:YdcF family protein n=1 Tax=Nocardia pulmonis TaxID=2951408 RepID=A0A9X2ED84_9NOCA|nr:MULTISPECIES: YdcF family protein [Nocardia]MCM6778767.1 YdcF family protein [Nocardia pulmonis]MCM6791656.1 YdcF family protein [Nocardia sp. CDC159]
MRADRGGANPWHTAATAGIWMIAVVAAAEWLHWRASRRLLGASTAAARTEAVVVLGFPVRPSGRTHPLQRWRCRIAARSLDPRAESVLVFTGGAVRREPAEAEAMARYARDTLGVPEDRIVTETKAESTWQNIEFSIPLIEHADRIKIASDPMHAARARRYLGIQRPDLAARLAAAADYRPLERWWLKIPTAAHELAAIARRNAGRLIRHLVPREVFDR